MPRDTTAPIRKFLILSNDPTGWIREGFIVPNDATVSVREGPIVSHEGTTPIRKSLILSNDAAVCVREGPIVPHEGTAWVAAVFSGSLFITEQTLSEIKQQLFYRDQIFISNKKSPVYTQ